MGGDKDRDNDRDNDGKMTSITRERQAATVPQVPLYFLANPAPFVVAPSGASRSYSSTVIVARTRRPEAQARLTITGDDYARRRRRALSGRGGHAP